MALVIVQPPHEQRARDAEVQDEMHDIMMLPGSLAELLGHVRALIGPAAPPPT